MYIRNRQHNIIKNNQIHSYDTRTNLNFHIENHNISIYKRKPIAAGSSFYNHLPLYLKNLEADTVSSRKISASSLNIYRISLDFIYISLRCSPRWLRW